MSDGNPTYVRMKGTDRLTISQLELLLRVASHVDETKILSTYDKRGYRKAIAKLATAWRRTVLSADVREKQEATARARFAKEVGQCNSNGSVGGLSADTSKTPQPAAMES